MTLGPRIFVLSVFSLLALSFLATTLVLAWEFWEDGRWLDFLAIDSHLFVFFPTFGLISLVAFYLPSCALVHLYWHHVKLGPQRLINGLLIADVFKLMRFCVNFGFGKSGLLQIGLPQSMRANKSLRFAATLVRQIAAMGGDVAGFVPPIVAAALERKFTP